ncbi:MAG: NnrS family protein [Betaproteobacteria bacterium]|nr:MAG: NnrS family protein [Betaproteobacteria bacterium]
MPLLTSPDQPSAHATPAPTGFALWNLGFRPFYLLAGLFATLSVPVWMAQYAGWLGGYVIIAGPLWHAHEMLFGYAFAVIVGFLFTAGRNWTNQPTPTGASLAAIAALWVAGRVLVFTPYALAPAAADTAFALAAAVAIAVPFVRSGNRRNYFFVALLLGMGLANLAFHLGMAGLLDLPLQSSLQVALDLVLFIMVVMGGRVIPMFTMNGVPGVFCARLPWIEGLAPGSILVLLAADVAGAPDAIIGPIAAVAAATHAARLILWRPWLTLKTPIVWILHLAYAWIVLALALRALAAWDLVPAGLATHALTVGAIGGLTLGMMTRTSLGHTGRPLRAGRAEVFCYVAIQLAALTRVFLPLVFPPFYLHAVIGSGLLWSLAFGVFTVSYWPILSRPRLDGRPG